MSDWAVIQELPRLPSENMASDYARLQNISINERPSIRFYQWHKNSATFGYFLKPENYLNKNSALITARRPTGGGIIFHDYDLSFSVLVPAGHAKFSINTLDNYAFVSQCLLKALNSFRPSLKAQLFSQKGEVKPHFCMASPTIYDLIVDGKKIAGGAQRKTKKGFLHQGTICLSLPSEEFFHTHLKNPLEALKIKKHCYPLLQNTSDEDEQKADLIQKLIAAFSQSG
ncbi:Octanoyltransferase LipM [Chlamydiales bacterium STE3]|nr:Octanoyltransferase LipM [Chlamydiales bacterium STE3]